MNEDCSRLINLAWVAGLLDGEGHFGIRASKARDGTPKWFRSIISLGMTSELACQRVAEITGYGTVRKNKQGISNKNPVWKWQITCRHAVEIAEMLLPYLVIKQEQAKIMIELNRITQKHPSRWTVLSTEELQARLLLQLQIQRLNRPHRIDYISVAARSAANDATRGFVNSLE